MAAAVTAVATAANTERRYLTDWLGEAPSSGQAAVQLVESGLPNTVVQRFLDHGLERNEVFDLVLPLRTWKHRKARRQKLSAAESERALRVARILAQARTTFGDAAAAMAWLRAPKRRFAGRSPLALLTTEPGGRLVEQFLTQIDEGMFA